MDQVVARKEEFYENLCRIVELLTCYICEKFLQNPVCLKCMHRFCERCIHLKLNKDDSQSSKCIHCRLSFSKNDIRQQSQLKMYILNLKNLVNLLYKEKRLNEMMAEFYQYVFHNKKFSELKIGKNFILKTHLTQQSFNSENYQKENLTTHDVTFEPKIFSTIMKPKNHNPRNFIAAENSFYVEDEFNPRVHLAYDTQIDPKLNQSKDESIEESRSDEQQIIKVIDSQTFNDETKVSVDEENDENDQEKETLISSYPTQSQYQVQKSTITYAHKELDKFDIVINNTKTNMAKNDKDNKKMKSKQEVGTSPPTVHPLGEKPLTNLDIFDIQSIHQSMRSDSPEFDLFLLDPNSDSDGLNVGHF